MLLIPWFKLEPWRIALPFGTVKVQPFGVLAALAMLVGAHFAQRRARELRLPDEVMGEFLTRTTFYGLIAAYLLNIAMYSPEEVWAIAREPSLLFTRWYGLSSYGGFIGGALAAVWFARRRRLSLLALGDAWCFAFPFAWVFARLGCFSVHDHPGVASTFFLAVDDYDHSGIARHDLGLYEALASVPLAVCFWLRSHRRQATVSYLALVLCYYGPVRFALDFLRATASDGGDIRYLGLTPAQYLSLALACAGARLALRLRNAWAPPPPSAAHAGGASARVTHWLRSSAGRGGSDGTGSGPDGY
jgi:phosphatidylglycerol:prolipoprotein diacylglycerol transferase